MRPRTPATVRPTSRSRRRRATRASRRRTPPPNRRATRATLPVASLAVDRYGADAAAHASGAEATSSQYGEIVSYANYGYLGRYDVGYTDAGKSSFDDHNSFEAYLLLYAGELLARSIFVDAAVKHYEAYAPHGSVDYVAYAACQFARVLPAAKTTCID